MHSNIAFIDIQGFKSNSNNFIVKELAAVFNNNEYINFIIKSPFDFQCLSTPRQREANWLTKNYHHIKWIDGSVTYKSVCKFFNSNAYSKIYTKGEEKQKWLEDIIQQTVINVEDIGCISFKQMENKYPDHFYCNYHTYGICALKNAFLLYNEITF